MKTATFRSRRLLVWSLRLGGLLFLVSSILLGIATFRGRISWFHRLSGTVVRIGQERVDGHVDVGFANDSLMVTVAVNDRRTSYLVTIPAGGRATAWHCGSWTAPFLPVYAITNHDQPCLLHGEGERNTIVDAVVSSPLRSVSFKDAAGAEWTATW